MSAAKNDSGLTLIELVIAMAVFALIAIMGLQSLTGMLRTRDALANIDIDATALSKGIALLRNDLDAILPLAFYPSGGAAPNSAIVHNSGGLILGMTIGGQPSFSATRAYGETHRSEWILDSETGALSRGVWKTAIPANASARGPDVFVMEGVTGISVRSFWVGQGWIEGLQNPLLTGLTLSDGDSSGVAAEVYSDLLPAGIEVILKTRDHGDIPLIQSLK